ncbi:unnamed protein product [Effrenium voratum]|nr:unnamed protein product [Effrenium voratum]
MSQARGRGGTAAKPEYVKESQNGDAPLPRFGHTTTFVGDNRVVLFGGATGDSGRYTITADAFMLNVSSNTWSRVQAEGTLPFARAAHAAACVDHSQMVIYGGATGGGSLSSDELYLLDIRNEERSQWMSVPVMGSTPGRRYGARRLILLCTMRVCALHNADMVNRSHHDLQQAFADRFWWQQRPAGRKRHLGSRCGALALPVARGASHGEACAATPRLPLGRGVP